MTEEEFLKELIRIAKWNIEISEKSLAGYRKVILDAEAELEELNKKK